MDGQMDRQLFMSKPRSKIRRWISTSFGGWGVRAVMLSGVALALMALPWPFPWPSGFPVAMYRSSHLSPDVCKCMCLRAIQDSFTGLLLVGYVHAK